MRLRQKEDDPRVRARPRKHEDWKEKERERERELVTEKNAVGFAAHQRGKVIRNEGNQVEGMCGRACKRGMYTVAMSDLDWPFFQKPPASSSCAQLRLIPCLHCPACDIFPPAKSRNFGL